MKQANYKDYLLSLALDKNEDTEVFAGSYIDDSQDFLHVNVVEGKKTKLPEGVLVHPVKYTLKQLNDLREKLRPHYGELGVLAAYVDPKSNKLIVKMDQKAERAQSLRSYALEQDMIEVVPTPNRIEYMVGRMPVAEFEQMKKANGLRGLINTKNGGRIYNYESGGYVSYSSLSSGCVWRAWGMFTIPGWVSCAHGKYMEQECIYAVPNDWEPYYPEGVFYSQQVMGYVVDLYRDSVRDISLVSQNYAVMGASDMSLNGIQANLQGGYPMNNAWIHSCGSMSGGQYGMVINNSVDAAISDWDGNVHFMNDLIMTDVATIPGDSGGQLLTLNASPSGQTSYSGYVIGGDGFTSVFGKTDHIFSVVENFSATTF